MATTETAPLTAADGDKLAALADSYRELRERCYNAARANDGALMGNDAWLRFAMSETDLEIYPGSNGIDCWGHCYSMQTMSNEHFSFFLPLEALA